MTNQAQKDMEKAIDVFGDIMNAMDGLKRIKDMAHLLAEQVLCDENGITPAVVTTANFLKNKIEEYNAEADKTKDKWNE